jgi:hypothetical protein
MSRASVLAPLCFGNCFEPFGMAKAAMGPMLPTMTNAQKLSLTLVPVAQQTGAIKVSGGTQDGIWKVVGNNGRSIYLLLGQDPETSTFAVYWNGSEWNLDDDTGTIYYSLSDVATPDLVVDVLPVFTIDFAALSIPNDSIATVNKYGKISNTGASNGAFLIELDAGLTLSQSYVTWDSSDGNLLTAGVFVNGDGTNQPTKQQCIDKLVALGGGRITDLGGLKIAVAPPDHLSDTISFAGGSGLAGAMTGSSYTTPPVIGWKNAADDTPASITVALATSSDMIDLGQEVAVSDGFAYAGDFYLFSSLSGNYLKVPHPDESNDSDFTNSNGPGDAPIWRNSTLGIYSFQVGDGPWDSTEWLNVSDDLPAAPQPTLTHPAIQQLAAPSDSFVVSDVVDDARFNARYFRSNVALPGIGSPSGGLLNGKPYYVSDNGFAVIYFGGEDGDNTSWVLGDVSGGIGSVARTLTVNDGAIPPGSTIDPFLVGWNACTLTPSPSADPTVVAVSGAGTAEANGIYYLAANQINGGPVYVKAGGDPTGEASTIERSASQTWRIYDSSGDGNVLYADQDGSLAQPWLVTDWASDAGTDPAPTVTAQIRHPAVFVGGAGTPEADGIYTERGVANGKPYYNLLGQADAPTTYAIYWDDITLQWHLSDSTPGNANYDSWGGEALPWLTTHPWVDDAASAPAPTFTPVTAGEFDAGVRMSGAGTATANGVIAGPVFHESGDDPNVYQWRVGDLVARHSGVYWGLGDVVNGLYFSAQAVAAPWLITDLAPDDGIAPAPTVIRNDVAAEANWDNV